MFNMVIIIIGLIEFIIGLCVTIFSKNVKVTAFIEFLYDLEEGDINSPSFLNRWIGGNYGLIGSMYILLSSISIYYNISWIILILAIISVEFISYKRINKGIKDILKNSQ